MTSENIEQTQAQARADRVYIQIIYALSWKGLVKEIDVPQNLWTYLQEGLHTGPLISSRTNIPDPDRSDVSWSAWCFLNGTIIIASNTGNRYMNLSDVRNSGLEYPGAPPKREADRP